MHNINLLNLGILLILIIDILGIVSVIFIERKKPSEIISWIFVIAFLPGIGFLLYLLIGETVTMRMSFRFGKKRIFDELWRKRHISQMSARADDAPAGHPSADKYPDIVGMFERQSASTLTTDNGVRVYTSGQEKFDELLADIAAAEKSVHLLYFTFNADHVGGRFVDLLAQKAAEGVEVRLLFDSIGNFPYFVSYYKKIVRAGGQVFRFFPLANILKVNYRNHRKIAVIDGRIAYTGGINVSKSYIGEHARARPWRDTHIRLTGSCVGAFQERFLLDWIHESKERFDFDDPAVLDRYFPPALVRDRGRSAVQAVSSGPDAEGEHIKYGYIKMINRAKSSLYMQSPYFIPDDAFMLALKLAVDSGVDVRIILPGIPDKRMVYLITRSYMRDLLRIGVRVYLYKGFIHSKMFIMDGEVTSIGTTNIDIRSFLLDFEINAFIYDREFAERCEEIFGHDTERSSEIKSESDIPGSIALRLLETVLKILSPLL